MPLPGLGVAPAAGSLYKELARSTRRAFVPRFFVQLYFGSPTLFYMLGGAQRSAGGQNQITIPMQGQSMVQGQFTGYGGGFNAPVITPGIQNGQWNTAFWVVPVPLPFGETIIQSTETVIPLLKARMNDVYATTRQNMARLFFTNNGDNPLLPNSFLDAFDNGTNFPSYGGINRLSQATPRSRASTSIWRRPRHPSLGTLGFTRSTMATVLAYVQASLQCRQL